MSSAESSRVSVSQHQSGNVDLEKRLKLMEISYEPPNLVKSQITAWVTTAQSVAVVTTLMVGTSTQLLGVIKSDDTLANIKGARIGLLIFSSYSAIISNVMATIACLFLLDRLGDIDLNQARKGENIRQGETEPVGSLKLLLDYGGDRAIGWILCQYPDISVAWGWANIRCTFVCCLMEDLLHHTSRSTDSLVVTDSVTTLVAGISSQFLGVIKSDGTLSNIKGARINLFIFSSYTLFLM
ncbi:hypothetical protein C8J56DRAFT_1115030 [Mycena floridula]|nr:hypothetical protein C8J56DRAFT_1115030 [Mycena floridula]